MNGITRWMAAVLALLGLSSPARAQEVAIPDLGQILARLDRVATLYRDAALQFTCEESVIHSSPDRPTRFFNFEYIYNFTQDAGLSDYRVDRRSTHKAGVPPPRARLSDYALPYYLTRGYSWIFLFDRAHQTRIRYSLGEETKVMGRTALPIQFEPISPIESDINDWFGTMWIDRQTLQPLRVEAIKAVEREQEQALREALGSTAPLVGVARTGWVFARVTTEFTHEKNSMRFPGKTIATGTRARIRIRKGKRVPDEQPLFTVTQLYSGYEFFGVRTEEAILGLSQADKLP